jgi:hypothetical protein
MISLMSNFSARIDLWGRDAESAVPFSYLLAPFALSAMALKWNGLKQKEKVDGYDRKHPYVSGVVELEEGVKVVARIEGVDGTKPETIKIGASVKVEFLHRGEGEDSTTLLAFRPS